MASMTIIHAPCNLAIVTLATKLALNNRRHGNVVASSPHFKYFRMANIACETDSMSPMWKNYRAHSLLVGMPVKYYICILTMGNWSNHRHTKRNQYHPMLNGHCNSTEINTPKPSGKPLIIVASKPSPVLLNFPRMLEAMA
jgi:hypothetical protein